MGIRNRRRTSESVNHTNASDTLVQEPSPTTDIDLIGQEIEEVGIDRDRPYMSRILPTERRGTRINAIGGKTINRINRFRHKGSIADLAAEVFVKERDNSLREQMSGSELRSHLGHSALDLAELFTDITGRSYLDVRDEELDRSIRELTEWAKRLTSKPDEVGQ